MEGGQKPKYFPEKRMGCIIVISKTACKSLVLSRCLIKTDKMKCLTSIWDSKIQICGIKAVWMLLGYLFCFKVNDQIKYSINESLITLDIGQWILLLNQMFFWNVSSASGSLIVAIGKDSHFVWLAFNTDQRFFWF